MKKIYSSLFVLSLFLTSQAQLTQATHAPANGDTYEMFDVNASGVSPGASGTNAVWNYTNVTVNSTIRGYSASTASDTTYSQANVKVVASTGDTAFYASSATDLKYFGGKISVSTIAAKITYTQAATFAAYPVQFNTLVTSPVSGNLKLNVFGTDVFGVFNGTTEVIADGSGTLSVPGSLGTFTATTRYKTTQVINFTVSTFIGPSSGTLTQISYDYLSEGIKAPVFSIATSTADVPAAGAPTTQTIVSKNKNAVGIDPPGTTTGLDDFQKTVNEVRVFPNPASGMLNFLVQNPKAAVIVMYDITGKEVERHQLIEGKLRLDVSSYQQGLYLYAVKTAGGKTLHTGKITVNH